MTVRSILLLAALLLPLPAVSSAPPDRPDVLLVTVDTLRADRLGAYGYARSTSPALDRLLSAGVRFSQARAVEPLTNPSTASMLTSVFPHEHGSTRNGIPVRRGLDSLPKQLRKAGWTTAAFVGNWTLKDRISGLAEHFDQFTEILNRRRWAGLIRSEATAGDLTDAAAAWVAAHRRAHPDRPFLLWVHYVEPHAPYRMQPEVAAQVGVRPGQANASDRYDTEVAFADREIGRLLQAVGFGPDTLVVFAADHGESLGEHGYWGHGRNLYEETLRIPMSVTWPGRVPAQKVEAPAQNIDVAPTVLGLLGLRVPRGWHGYDWTATLTRGDRPPVDRPTLVQAHKGAVLSETTSGMARRSGLLEVGVVQHGRKEVFRIEDGERRLFDLRSREAETRNLVGARSRPSEELLDWMKTVYTGLTRSDETSPESTLDPEAEEKLRSLGYVE